MYILKCVLTYKESCHKCIRSWYFSWHTLKYTDHYTDLIHPASSLYLPYTNRYTDCVRPEEGSLYRPFHAVNVQDPGGGGGYLTMFCTGRLRPEVQPLTLSYTILAEKVPLLYTFYWKKIPLSHTYFRRSCSSFHVVLNKWTSATFRGVYSKNYN